MPQLKDKLTVKQDKFSLFIAEGKEPLEAYDLAKYSQKQKPATRSNNAYKLLQNNDIITRINEYKEENKKKHEYTVEKLVKELDEIEGLAKQPIHGRNQNNYDLTNWLKVKSEKAKLFGLYAPTKTDNTHKGEIQTNSPAMIEATNNLAKAIKSKK